VVWNVIGSHIQPFSGLRDSVVVAQSGGFAPGYSHSTLSGLFEKIKIQALISFGRHFFLVGFFCGFEFRTAVPFKELHHQEIKHHAEHDGF
jgi:hypothetical protein